MNPYEESKRRIKRMLKDRLGKELVLFKALGKYISENKDKPDYGLSDAGILPRSTAARTAFLQKCGYASVENKKPYEIARMFTKRAGIAVTELRREAFRAYMHRNRK